MKRNAADVMIATTGEDEISLQEDGLQVGHTHLSAGINDAASGVSPHDVVAIATAPVPRQGGGVAERMAVDIGNQHGLAELLNVVEEGVMVAQ